MPSDNAADDHRRQAITFAYSALTWLALSLLAALTGILLVSGEKVSDSRLLLAVTLAGAGGATLQAFTALIGYIGNRAYQRSWTAYFVLRPFAGAGMALLVYVSLRAALLDGHAGVAGLNFYGVLSLSFLSGLYSRTALARLTQIFEVLFEARDMSKFAKSRLAVETERLSSVRRPLEAYHGYLVLQLSPVKESRHFTLTVWTQPDAPPGLSATKIDIGEGLPPRVTKFRVSVYGDGCDAEPFDAELRVETDKPQSESLVFALMCPTGSPAGLVELSQYGRTVSVVSFGGNSSP